MEVVNELLPTTKERIEAMNEPGPDGPIYMVNLLRFRDKAEYADGRETDLSGRDAYQLYGKGLTDVLARFGAEIVWSGDVTFLSIGQVEDLWDEVAVVKYPNRNALLQMSTSNEWREASVHRAAGLIGQLNIEAVDPK